MKAAFCIPVSRDWCVLPMLEYLRRQKYPCHVDYYFHFDEYELAEKWARPLNALGSVKFIVTEDGILPDNAPNELRRMRVCNIWEDFQREVSKDYDYLFGMEDDTIPTDNAFAEMLDELDITDAAFVSGVEAGRHGYKMIGGWDITPNEVSTVAYQPSGYRKVDGTGLYCFVTWAKYLHSHEFHSEAVCLGPDVVFFRDIVRKHGKKGKLDFGIKCLHLQPNGQAILVDEKCIVVVFKKQPDEAGKPPKWVATFPTG